jgi:hypothetical protein
MPGPSTVIGVADKSPPIRAAYCTIINASFVPRALALQQSIAKRSPDAVFALYCIDDATAALLRRHAGPHVLVIPPAAYETAPLRAARSTLKLNEYCWTCKPAILLHALETVPELQWAVWLDSDMLAFGDLDDELRRHADANVILTPHRFSLPEFAAYEPTVGRFNAGYVAFHNTAEGTAALRWWMARCLEGCPAVPTQDRYADQKYLDALAEIFPRVAKSRSPGLNCAPWNVFGKVVSEFDGRITIDEAPLVLYHFQGLKIVRTWAFDLYGSLLRLPGSVRQLIYAPYLDTLMSHARSAASAEIPWMGIDAEFAGMPGLWKAAKRLLWSSNLEVSLPIGLPPRSAGAEKMLRGSRKSLSISIRRGRQ